MKCPRCGSQDVEDTRDSKTEEIYCECENCGHQWTQSYDPNPTFTK